MRKICALATVIMLSQPIFTSARNTKIVGLLPVRNEEIFIANCLEVVLLKESFYKH